MSRRRGSTSGLGATEIVPERCASRTHRGLLGRTALAAIALVFAAATSSAQDVQELENGELLITFDEINGTSLLEFLAIYEKFSNRAIAFNKDDLKGTLIFQLGQVRVNRERFDAFFGAVLRNHDFLLVQFGPQDAGFWSLRKTSGQGGRGTSLFKALAEVIPPDELAERSDNPGLLVTTSYTCQHLPARDAVNTLQPYFGDNFTDNIRNIEGTQTILMTGFANTLQGIHRLLTEIDVEPPGLYPTVVTRELKHAVAEEIVTVVEQLVQAYQGGVRQPGQPAGARRGNANLPNAEPEPSVIADPRTNTLIVSAGDDTMGKILSWIDQLDVEVQPSGIYVYRLRNSQATAMADVVQQIMEASQSGRSGGARPGGGGQPGGQGGGTRAGTGTGEQPVTIVPDIQTNSLVISASKTRYAQILDIVRQLDIRPEQVLIQAALVEVTESLGEAISVELTGINTDSDDDSFFGITSYGLTQLIDTDNDGFVDSKALPDELANGLTGGIFDPNDFPLPFVLNALKNTSEANVLSLPSILTNDNQEATITAKDSVPFTQINQGQNSDSVTRGGDEEAGITLIISPTISAGGYLSLSIELTVSAFTGASSDPAVPPPSQERTINAQVTIPDGHTMIIGGVMTNDARRDENKVPILGDIPLIGFLFRNSSENASKTNLYFFLTPSIISDDFSTLDELTRLHMQEAALLGGQVHMLNRFDLSKRDADEINQLSGALLDRVFQLPAYASVTDHDAQPDTDGEEDDDGYGTRGGDTPED